MGELAEIGGFSAACRDELVATGVCALGANRGCGFAADVQALGGVPSILGPGVQEIDSRFSRKSRSTIHAALTETGA